METKASKRVKSSKLRSGDTVVVIAGNAKGQSGKIVRLVGEKVVVQGLNMCKKHVKRSQQNPKGGVIEMERPIDISNVAACDEAGEPIKLHARFDSAGQKELVYEKDGELVTWRSMKRSKE